MVSSLVNCSLKGDGYSSTLIFDETTTDIVGFKSRDQNVYISQLTIQGGGGHFTSTQFGSTGLFDCVNHNVALPAPFYGRNKRFKVHQCNIIAPFQGGSIQGFGTLNWTGNFWNGGGGSPSGIYTFNECVFTDGLEEHKLLVLMDEI